MTILYHIHRGNKEIKFNKNRTTFMSKKNSFWYNIEIRIGKNDYNGYVEYIINIPENRFTKSLNPKDNTKVLILNKDNIERYNKLYPNRKIDKTKFGGIDATRITIDKKNPISYHEELLLWNWKDVDVKVSKIINSKMKPPVKNVVCDTGLISEKGNKEYKEFSNKYGELIDIYCVALGKKPLAALNLKKIKKDNNKILEFCNSRNVEYLHYKKATSYLKDIFFLPNNKENAYKLLYILESKFTEFYFKIYEIFIAIGLLLGYNKENIIYFNKRNNIHITNIKDIKLVEEKIKKLNYYYNDLLFDDVEHFYQI